MVEDCKFMKEALALARLALDEGEIPVGSLLVRNKEIIGRGGNRRKRDGNPLAHAEMDALAAAGLALGSWRFDDCTLYSTLEPCPMCAGAIMQARVGRVVYAARDPRAGAAGSLYDILRDRRLSHRCSVREGVLAAESADLLRRFFQEKRAGRENR